MSLLPSSSFSYSIFLSFNGTDTRKSFTDHLYHALDQQGIVTFKDDKSLERGEDFAPELLRAIGESWGSIIVISERYAFSPWCLIELVEIMKQRKERGHKVYPIFYHVEPSDFRHQIKNVKDAFDKHQKRHDKETTEGWRAALKEVTDINGWPLKDQHEYNFIQDIVKDISEKCDAKIVDEKEVETMKNNFRMIQAWLADREIKQYMKEGEVLKVCYGQLKRIAYEMDDVLDEWNTAVLKSKIEKDQAQSPSISSSSLSEVQLSIGGRDANPSRLLDLNLPPPEFDIPTTSFQSVKIALCHHSALRIKELNEEYQAILKDCPFTQCLHSSYNDLTHLKLERRKTASLVDESVVYGRDFDKAALIRSLLIDANDEGRIGNDVPVLAIIGMGGVGKTTLAQLAYNDGRVKNHFDKRIWVCVSNPFDEVRIAKAILEALDVKTDSIELESLLQKIFQNIERKKYLLVLDDVWAEDQTKWEQLKLSLSVGSQESRILVTTRKERVASSFGCQRSFPLKVLSQEDGWSLFSKIAFFGRNNQDRENLESIGREFVKKCAGLPLAIKTLASFLRFKDSEEQWRRILNSEMWKREEFVSKNLYAPLMLSYHDLPMSTKQCFRYCAIFPKDHQIKRDDLIKLWMAQGFLGETHEVNDLEINGNDCFNNLAVHGFFQQFKKDEIDGSIYECRIHDIVHDFAQFLTKTECALAEIDGCNGVNIRVESTHEDVRHLTLENPPSSFDYVSLLVPFKKLRSFHVLNYNLFDASLPKLYHQLINLRMLSFQANFSRDGLSKIPKEIGDLIHLRYLSLENNISLFELPETVCDLCNLQTLNIKNCRNLGKLPHGMGKLINLRHLQNEGVHLTFMPKAIERLTCLQTLVVFCVVEKGREGIETGTSFRVADLGKLIHLHGSLDILWLGNVEEANEAPNLTNAAGLRELTLSFLGGDDKEHQKKIKDDACFLQALQPPPDLRSLGIHYCEGTGVPFPNWMTSLTSLKSIELVGCDNWETLPPLGKLQSLESLKILHMEKVKKVGAEFVGVETSSSSSSSSVNHNMAFFPKLKTLQFTNLYFWEEWEYENESGGDASSSSSNIIMPKLQTLSIDECPWLKTLPRHLLQKETPLRELEIKSNCVILEMRYNRETGEDWPSISHIPTVRINGIMLSDDESQQNSIQQNSILIQCLQMLKIQMMSSFKYFWDKLVMRRV